jgi:hypothetical protein
MRCRICPSCGADTSKVPVKKRSFARFLAKVIRCPHCKLRKTVLTIRKSDPGLVSRRTLRSQEAEKQAHAAKEADAVFYRDRFTGKCGLSRVTVEREAAESTD